MSRPRAPIDPAVLRAQLVASGALRPGDEQGLTPTRSAATIPLDDTARRTARRAINVGRPCSHAYDTELAELLGRRS